MSTKTYTRKTRAGWKVVHREMEGTEISTTVVQPLSREDARLVRETFAGRGKKS